MTDISALIERLRAWKSLRACDFEENSPLAEDLEAAAQALQQQERENAHNEKVITGLNKQLNDELVVNRMLGAEMEKQAREIERLKTQLHDSHVSHAKSLSELGNRTIRLGELEAERDKLRETLEIPAPSPPCMMPDGGECCPQYHAAVIRIDKLRETLAGMPCSRQINAGTIADCTGRNQCYCPEGAAFVKTGASQK